MACVKSYVECTVWVGWERGLGVTGFEPRNKTMNLAVKGQTSLWRHLFKMLSESVLEGLNR